MRNNVYSDTFWYGDMFLPVWAKNEKFSKFHIQYIWKIVRGWHHQLAHLNIHKDWSRSVFQKNLKFQNVIISHPIFIIFSLFCRKKCTFSFKIDSILEWISPLTEVQFQSMDLNKPPLWILAKVTSRQWKWGGGGAHNRWPWSTLFHCLQSPEGAPAWTV